MPRLLKYGIISGIAVAAYSTTEFLLGLHSTYLNIGHDVGYLRYVLVAVGIYLAVKQAKDVQAGAPFTFWRAVGIGTSIYEWAYIQFINPNFIHDYTDFTLNQMRGQRASAEQISQMMTQMETFSSIGVQFLFYVSETTLVGFIFSLIAGALLRTKQPAEA